MLVISLKISDNVKKLTTCASISIKYLIEEDVFAVMSFGGKILEQTLRTDAVL
jgi:hypothetical protein